MAKSLRSKIQGRWKKLKRGHIDNVVIRQKENKVIQTLNAVALGLEYRQKQQKNAYLHPNDPNSVFPQFKPAPIIDLRSTSIPGSGTQWSGANRKGNKTTTQQFKDFGEIEAEARNERERQSEQVQQKMYEQRNKQVKTTQIHKPKKQRKSKLRKTIVF